MWVLRFLSWGKAQFLVPPAADDPDESGEEDEEEQTEHTDGDTALDGINPPNRISWLHLDNSQISEIPGQQGTRGLPYIPNIKTFRFSIDANERWYE